MNGECCVDCGGDHQTIRDAFACSASVGRPIPGTCGYIEPSSDGPKYPAHVCVRPRNHGGPHATYRDDEFG